MKTTSNNIKKTQCRTLKQHSQHKMDTLYHQEYHSKISKQKSQTSYQHP